MTCNEVYEKLWKHVKPFAMLEHEHMGSNLESFLDKFKSALRIRVTDAAGKTDRILRTRNSNESTSILPLDSNDKVADLMRLKDTEKVRTCSIHHDMQCVYPALTHSYLL